MVMLIKALLATFAIIITSAQAQWAGEANLTVGGPFNPPPEPSVTFVLAPMASPVAAVSGALGRTPAYTTTLQISAAKNPASSLNVAINGFATFGGSETTTCLGSSSLPSVRLLKIKLRRQR